MSSIFKDKGIYYLQVTRNYRSIKQSLKTGDYRIAKKRARLLEPELVDQLFNPNIVRHISFAELCAKFLSVEHEWTDRTRETYEWVLNAYNKTRRLPDKPATRVTFQGRLNTVIEWGKKNNYRTDIKKFDKKKMPSRNRVFSTIEMLSILDNVQNNDFNQFIRFAYYTGARRGELSSLKKNKIREDHIEVTGKTGIRIVKLNDQSKKVIKDNPELWDYSNDYISHKFKKELRRLDIPDGRFHDLRRTFGFNLIKSGTPIYEVSKLLGHKSVKTTEYHYAPLLVSDIKDFVL